MEKGKAYKATNQKWRKKYTSHLQQYSKTFHLSYKCVSVYAYLDNCNMQCQWIIKANSSREEEDVQKVSTRETQKMHLATASMVFKIPF
ncbi:hypothetical protein GYH30_023361 [Glycine max]|uniref:Uncharacterized protein n=1 Tax=Glycine max TaxID=3847 RepID=A0A0R0J2E9_SOYBN|nr:hypothetical protein GYH30_023361 [Glycine max]